jgi:hypothetical protein
MIKIDFEFDAEPYGVFRDALHLSEDHGLSDAEIDALKQERFDNWMAIINAPASEEEVVEETLPPPTINIAGTDYALLEGAPLSGQSLIEVNSHWYYKV